MHGNIHTKNPKFTLNQTPLKQVDNLVDLGLPIIGKPRCIFDWQLVNYQLAINNQNTLKNSSVKNLGKWKEAFIHFTH